MNQLLSRLRVQINLRLRDFFQGPPFSAWQLAPVEGLDLPIAKVDTRSAKEIVEQTFDGFLWEVQKVRRSVERRTVRKFGAKNWAPHGYKMIDPKSNIIVCHTCGNFHESQYLCNHCYNRVMEETKLIQKQINDAHGYEPIEKEVRVRYKGDQGDYSADARLVEIDSDRPSWFSKNLLSRTTGNVLPETNVTIKEEK
ncbi:39S ribosomal protein L32, mitochondrial [Halotydeus destructor]|nr:39S ribosomal protein L32, mitochondrial [Halotydeus destructor]